MPANTTAILSGGPSLLDELSAPASDSSALSQSASKDGRFVAFTSDSDGLSSEDDNGVANVYVKDMSTGAVTLASRRTGAAGEPSHNACSNAAISDDGTRVAFQCAGPLDPADTNGATDVYVRDLTTSTTLLVSRQSGDGAVGDRVSEAPAINQDGTKIAFDSVASNLAGIMQFGVYVANTQTHTTTLVSDPPGPGAPDGPSRSPSISNDGNTVAFESSATNLVSADTNAATDVFVATVSTGGIVLASRASGAAGTIGDNHSNEAAISGDGNVVAFSSASTNLAPAIDNETGADVYERSLSGTPATTVVDATGGTKGNDFALDPSIDDHGDVIAFKSFATNFDPAVQPDTRGEVYVVANGGAPVLASRASGASGDLGVASSHPSMSGDGGSVAFTTEGSLTGDVVPGIETVAQRRFSANTTSLVSGPPGSGPFSNQAGNSFGGSMSADGRFVAFISRAPGLGVPPGVQSALIVRDTKTGATVIASRADGAGGAVMHETIDPVISADGHRVAFEDEPPTGPSHIWVRDLTTDSTILVDRANGASGDIGNNDGFEPALDATGDRVAFSSNATNLDPGDTDNQSDVYVRDIAHNTLTLASRAVNGDKGNADSDLPSMSADGDHVAFTSAATNLGDGDTDTLDDVHMRDLAEGTTRLVSVASAGQKGDSDSDSPSVSADGNRVAFASRADNLGTTPGNTSEGWVHDFAAGTTELISRHDGPSGAAFDEASFSPLLSADGRVAAFTSQAPLRSRGVLGIEFDAFRRDLATGTTSPVSLAPGPDGGTVPGTATGIRGDGGCVVFNAQGGLLGQVPGAEDYTQVYMRTFASNCGGAPVNPPARDTTAPVLRSVSLTHTRFRVAKGATKLAAQVARRIPRGTQLRFTSSEAAQLTILIERVVPGRKVRKGHTRVCKPVHKRPKHGACNALRRRASLTRNVNAGRGRVSLTGRIGKRRMAPGRYRLTLTAKDGAGNRSKPIHRSFTILAG